MNRRINIYDNNVILLLFLFLPFSQALTFNIGFPLKISEVMLFILLFLIITSKYFSLKLELMKNPLSLLLIWSLFSVLINLLWQYNHELNINYSSRAGYELDSILKWFYCVLAISLFYISSNVFTSNQSKYIKYFLIGAFVASLYSWYLFIFSLFGIEPLLLFGMEENPQRISLAVGEVMRCGTYKEGNFMAFFLFISTVFAMYNKKKKIAIFFTLSIITTVSTIGILTALFFWLLYILKTSNTKKGMLKLIFIAIISMSSLIILLQNDDFNMMFTSKLDFSSSEIKDQGAYSKEDRKNTILNALNMGIDNPVFGIGLSNFALHYKYYNEIYGSGFDNYDFKVIQNNVYAEIFSELGFIGLFLFGWFLSRLYTESKRDKSKILTFGLIGSFIYFMAFPSFTILFIWVFFGLIHSLPKDNYEISH